VADDRKKIDEDLGAQQIVYLAFARRVPTHQALQRCGFVGCEVVDVQVGIGHQAPAYEVDKALECGSFVLPIGGPIPRVLRGAVSIEVKIPEQKFEPAVSDEWVTFEVEKDVACRGFRKAR